MGFNDRKRIKRNPQNPGKLILDWRTFDNCWRYNVRGDGELMKSFFPGLSARYGDARNLKFIVLEPALYQVTGRNKAGSHRVSSNLCLPGVMDRLVVYRRAIRADDWEIIGKGYYSDIKDEVTSNRNGGQWANTVAIYLLQGEFAPYDPDKDEVGKFKEVKIGQIAYLTMRGFSSKLGWDKSAAAHGLDPRNCAGVVASNTESFLNEAEKKSEKDKYYPSFKFLQFEEVPKIGDKLRDIGNEAFDKLDAFLKLHFDYYSEDPDEEPEEGLDDGPVDEDAPEPEMAPRDTDEPGEEKKKRGSRKTKTEQAVEARRKELKGEAAMEKVTEEEPEENEEGGSDPLGDLPF